MGVRHASLKSSHPRPPLTEEHQDGKSPNRASDLTQSAIDSQEQTDSSGGTVTLGVEASKQI